MSQTLTLELPEDMYQALQKEANVQKKTLEQVALDWMAQRIKPRRGSVEAIMPFYGAWQMAPEERVRIEREIYEDRHREVERAARPFINQPAAGSYDVKKTDDATIRHESRDCVPQQRFTACPSSISNSSSG